jgi:hypothetical protein
MMRVFAHRYGFLGLFREAFASPVLPARADPLTAFVAPDALIDQGGRLRAIAPETEGKRLLEDLLERRRGPRTSGGRITLKRSSVTWPEELRFPELGMDFGGGLGLIQPMFGWRRSSALPYDKVRERFGIRFVLDEHARAGVSIITTREPLDFWLSELEAFQPAPAGPAYFDGTLEGVSPRAVANDDGSLASSWRCPSLLKAVYLMLYLDKTAGVRLQKCRAPGCPEYYRVGPRSRESLYCPPPPGRKQSRCASRASSQMYRERRKP